MILPAIALGAGLMMAVAFLGCSWRHFRRLAGDARQRVGDSGQ
jgi:hypothetical protein